MLSDSNAQLDDTNLEDLPFYLARAGISFRRFNDRTLRAVGLKPQAPGMASARAPQTYSNTGAPPASIRRATSDA